MSDHECTTDASIVEQTKKTYKRRSSIFQVNRRFQDDDITSEGNEAENGAKNQRISEEESFDLPAYITRLRTERKCWKETLHKRKSRRRNLQRENAIVKKQGTDYNLDLLPEAERSFVLARPAYQEIAKNIRDLGEKAIMVGTLVREAKTMKERLASVIEKRLSAAEKNIIEMTREEA